MQQYRVGEKHRFSPIFIFASSLPFTPTNYLLSLIYPYEKSIEGSPDKPRGNIL